MSTKHALSRFPIVGVTVALLWLAAGSAHGQSLASDCQPSWVPTFGQMPGPGYGPMAVFDDGSGPALYFAQFGALRKWDGATWSTIPLTMTGGIFVPTVSAMAVHDDGTGPALYLGGAFDSVAGVQARNVAKWNGAVWSAAATGPSQYVSSLKVFDDGFGPALYASCFEFWPSFAGSVHRRQGVGGWVPVGFLPSAAGPLEAFDSGTGPALYVGTSGGSIHRWLASSWSVVGATDASVLALKACDLGDGAALYAAGSFTSIGGVPANRAAKWDGTAWSALGDGADERIDALEAFDDGSGPALYAAGLFTSAGGVAAHRAAQWDGSAWSPLPGDLEASGLGGFALYDDGAGPSLFSNGSITSAGEKLALSVARWNAAGWSPLGSGGLSVQIDALAIHDDGGGTALYAGAGGGAPPSGAPESVVRWDGRSWTAPGGGTQGKIEALVSFDDGGGPRLFVGGVLTSAGGQPVNRIAKWDGSTWSSLQQGLDGVVLALAAFDDGSGPALYAGGSVLAAIHGPVLNGIGKWDGSSWSPLDGGLFLGAAAGSVRALAVFDDGSGPALYAGGQFDTAGGVPASHIARWDGGGWSALGGGAGPSSPVDALAVFDDGSGPALYAGGQFVSVDGVPANRIAKWDGTTWTALGDGLSNPAAQITGVAALAVFDDGSGPALYAGGQFTLAGGLPASRLARWNGSAWSALGSGVSGAVLALCPSMEGDVPVLHVGGAFEAAYDSLDSFVAKWAGCPPLWTDLGFDLAGTVGEPQLAGTGSLEVGTTGVLALSHAAPSSLARLFISASSTPLPFKCGTLVPVPVLLDVGVVTSPFGGFNAGWASWPAGLAGVSLYFQYAVQDAGAPCGVALSNALRADVP